MREIEDRKAVGALLIVGSVIFLAFIGILELVLATTWDASSKVLTSQEMVVGMIAVGGFVLVLVKGIQLRRGR